MTVCKLSVNSVIMYYGTLASWSVAQHKKFDSVMNNLYRKVYKLMPGTASDLLALPNELGGLNCAPICDKLFESKWATIQRNFHSVGEKKAAVCDLVQRSNRQNGIHLLPGQGSIVLPTSKLYVSSMLQTAEDHGLYLFVGGSKMQGTSYEQVKTTKEMFEPDDENMLCCDDIITIGDLTQVLDPDDDVRTFIPELSTKYKCVANRIDIYNPPQETLMLRPKQCWLICNIRSWYVVEFLGIVDGRIAVRKWDPIDCKACPNPKRTRLPCTYEVKIDSYSLSTGAGSSCTYLYDELFPRKQATRVIMGGDIIYRKKITRKLVNVYNDVRPLMPEVHVAEDKLIELIRRDLADYPDHQWDIFTDGSRLSKGGSIRSIFDESVKNVISGGGLVFVSRCHDWKQRRIFLYNIKGSAKYGRDSAYPMELLCLTLALHIVDKLKIKGIIYTDCKAAMDAVKNRGRVRKWSKRANYILLDVSSRLYMNVHKVPAHPERAETDKRKWTRHMWGNHLADIAASSDPYRLVREGFEDIVQIGIDIDDILQSIAISPGLFWGRRDGVPILESLMDARHQSTLMRYLKRRDKYRADRGDGPKWVGRTIQFGVKTWEMKWRNEADKSRMVRIGWD